MPGTCFRSHEPCTPCKAWDDGRAAATRCVFRIPPVCRNCETKLRLSSRFEFSENSNRDVRRNFVSQLRQTGGIRKTHRVAAALPSSHALHGVHGSWERKHVPGITAHCEEISRSRHQLGPGRGENTNLPSMGFLEASLHRSRTGSVVS